jgi:hypothetical protein
VGLHFFNEEIMHAPPGDGGNAPDKTDASGMADNSVHPPWHRVWTGRSWLMVSEWRNFPTGRRRVVFSTTFMGSIFTNRSHAQCFEPGQRVAEHPHFFSFLERARTVVHRQFNGAIALADEFDEQLEVEVEAVAFKFQPVKAVAAKNLEHGERIAEPLKKQDVDERCEKPVAEIDEQAQAMLPR